MLTIVVFLSLPVTFFRVPPAPPPSKATIERHGLRITLEAIRQEQCQVEITYSFTWLHNGEPPLCFMRPWDTLTILFWDAEGKKLPEETRGFLFFMDEDFLSRKTSRHEGRITFHLASWAKSAAIGFPGAKMITPRIAIPWSE